MGPETRHNVQVSAVIPCYNSSAFLADTIQSVIAQTLSEIEIIFVDDGSSDDSVGFIERTIATVPEPAMRLIVQPNAGVAAARNRGISEARGRYVLPLDADDLIEPTMVEECFITLEANPEVAVVYTDRRDFGDIEKIWPAGAFDLERLKYFNQLPYCSMFRRSLWADLGGYRQNVSGFDDWDFWIAAASRGFHGAHLAKPLLKHRRRRDSAMWGIIDRYEELYARIIANNPQAYSGAELEAARGFISDGVPASVLQASKFVFLSRYYEGYPCVS
jgi:glycosyltransferase involved in cell wall biosynthesis